MGLFSIRISVVFAKQFSQAHEYYLCFHSITLWQSDCHIKVVARGEPTVDLSGSNPSPGPIHPLKLGGVNEKTCVTYNETFYLKMLNTEH